MVRYKLLVLLCVIWVSFGVESFGREYEVTSPDKNLRLKVDVKQKILYTLGYKSKQLIKPSPIALTLCGNMRLGANLGLCLRGGSNESLYGKFPAFALTEKVRNECS